MMKSDKVASSFRTKADELFTQENYLEALQFYNSCLRFAINNSPESSSAFASRAEIYYKIGLHAECIENIQMARNSENLIIEEMKKLKELEEKCESERRNGSNTYESDKWDFFKLSHEANKKIPFIADCLEVRENQIYGRYIATTKDLAPGDVVIVEKPFYKVLSALNRHLRCSVCLKQNSLNLIPCTNCTTAMFCSKKCADSKIHTKFECDKMEDNFEKALLQRMFYQAIEICGSLEEIEKLMNQHDPKMTIMNFDFSDSDDVKNLKKRMLATMTLAEREPWSNEAYAKYETVTKQLEVKTEHERDFLRSYLVHCLKSMTVNFFHYFWTGEEGNGFAICSLAAYFAHSCDPNCDKIDVDNKFVFIARKPIKADEQLTICYDRYNFLTHPLSDRKEYFNRVYTFDCACFACANNYQELDNLPKFDKGFNGEPQVNLNSFDAMKKQYAENCEYIQDNIKHYPSYEICTLMNQNNRLLHSMGNLLPF